MLGSIVAIADAVTTTKANQESNFMVYLESERIKAEERESIRRHEIELAKLDKEEQRRKDDDRFQMQMAMIMALGQPRQAGTVSNVLQPSNNGNQSSSSASNI